MIKRFNANHARLRRHQRLRNHLEGSKERPRLNIYRSGQHIYAQIVDDTTGKTLAAASSLDETLRDFKPAVKEQEKGSAQAPADNASAVEAAAEIIPIKGKGAKTEKPAQKAPAKGTPQKGAQGKGGKPGTQVKILLPAAQKGSAKTPVEALEAIAHNRKVATAR